MAGGDMAGGPLLADTSAPPSSPRSRPPARRGMTVTAGRHEARRRRPPPRVNALLLEHLDAVEARRAPRPAAPGAAARSGG
jgi:hypothetical protein